MKVCGGPILVCILKVLKNIFYWMYAVHSFGISWTIYIYIFAENVYFHTPLIWSCIICRHFRNTCSENFKFSSSHIWHPGWHLTYRYYKESIVCRRALLVGLPVFDVIDQITYLRLSIIILEIFRGVTNSWLKSCRTLMWVECGYRFYWETPRTIK